MRPIRLLLGAMLALVASAADAQYATDRPIRLIVPFAAGSGTDVAARLLATSLAEAIKRPIVIENKPGALATIGTDAAAKSPPDGHTLVATGSTALAAAPSLFKKLPYDPVADFAPVYLLATAPLALFVSSESPAKDLQALVAEAKASPGKLSYASGNATGAVAGEMLKQFAGIDIFHVPYKNSPQALNDVAGGQVTMMFNDIAGATPLVKAGKLRPLAVTSRSRARALPDVPTLYDAGYRGYELYNWVGILAPAKTSSEIVGYLAREIAKVAAQPDFKDKFERVGLDLVTDSGPDTFAGYIKTETANWSRQIRAAGIQPE
jgi:tripartite-type tricarboxylate transporter receptor subunit TctC